MKIVDLFSGCGGMTLGFQKAGFKVISAYDNWKPAVETYKLNFDHPIYDLDLSIEENYDHVKSKNADIIIGGPPCQDFSSAGKRDESLGRADLTLHFSRIIVLAQPKFFVMENVDRIIKSNTLIQVKKILSDAGYGLTQTVLNASLCGVPQNRKRYFLIGELNGNDNSMEYHLSQNLQDNPTTIFDYLGDKLGTEYYYRHPRSYARRGIFSIYEPSTTVRGVNRPIPPNYKFHPGDAIKDFSKVRPLTFQERAQIQTFPEDFEFHGNNGNREQQIGNAVPVELAKFVACALLDYMKNPESGMLKGSNNQLKINM